MEGINRLEEILDLTPSYIGECANLALHLIKHSTTPHRFSSIDELDTPRKIMSIGDLTFNFTSLEEFNRLVGGFNFLRYSGREVTLNGIRNFMGSNVYRFGIYGGKLRVADVGSLVEALFDCL